MIFFHTFQFSVFNFLFSLYASWLSPLAFYLYCSFFLMFLPIFCLVQNNFHYLITDCNINNYLCWQSNLIPLLLLLERSSEEGALLLFLVLHLHLLLLLLLPSLQLQSVHLLHPPDLLWGSNRRRRRGRRRRRRRRRAAQCGEEARHGDGAPQQAGWLRLQPPSSSSVLSGTSPASEGQRWVGLFSCLLFHL